jgi:toxin ParE1/3/4
MKEYSLTDLAKDEVRDIWEFIARDNEDAADRWIARIVEAFDMLARNPHIGHTRTDLADRQFLFWPIGEYLAIYRIVNEDIEIVAVTQGARDIPSYLRRRS